MNNPLYQNIAIIVLIGIIALYLKQPLAIIALFWLQPLPQPEYEEEYADAEGEEATIYDESSMGFTSELKSKK